MNHIIEIKNDEKEYIGIHSEILNSISDDFWKEEICNLLRNEITNKDNETRQLLLKNPYSEFIIYDDCFVFGYRPNLRKLICLNEYSVIHDIDSTEIPSAIQLIFKLHNEYGYINGTYQALLAQCQ